MTTTGSETAMTVLDWYEREEARILGRLKEWEEERRRPKTLWERLRSLIPRGAQTTPAVPEAAADDSGLNSRPGGRPEVAQRPERFDLDLLDNGLDELEGGLHRGTRGLRRAARRLHRAGRRLFLRKRSRPVETEVEVVAQVVAGASIPVEVQAEKAALVLGERVTSGEVAVEIEAVPVVEIVATRVHLVHDN